MGFKPKVVPKKSVQELMDEGVITKGTAPKTTAETKKKKSMIDPKLTEEANKIFKERLAVLRS